MLTLLVILGVMACTLLAMLVIALFIDPEKEPKPPRKERKEVENLRNLLDEIHLEAAEHMVLGDAFATIVATKITNYKRGR